MGSEGTQKREAIPLSCQVPMPGCQGDPDVQKNALALDAFPQPQKEQRWMIKMSWKKSRENVHNSRILYKLPPSHPDLSERKSKKSPGPQACSGRGQSRDGEGGVKKDEWGLLIKYNTLPLLSGEAADATTKEPEGVPGGKRGHPEPRAGAGMPMCVISNPQHP